MEADDLDFYSRINNTAFHVYNKRYIMYIIYTMYIFLS